MSCTRQTHAYEPTCYRCRVEADKSDAGTEDIPHLLCCRHLLREVVASRMEPPEVDMVICMYHEQKEKATALESENARLRGYVANLPCERCHCGNEICRCDEVPCEDGPICFPCASRYALRAALAAVEKEGK